MGGRERNKVRKRKRTKEVITQRVRERPDHSKKI